MCTQDSSSPRHHGIGHIDFGSLSQQTLIELLIERVVFAHRWTFIGDSGLVKDACACPGVRCSAAGFSHWILWDRQFEGGFMDIQWLPLTTSDFFACHNNLHGTLHLTRLPDGLRKLVVRGNKFSGTVDLTRLPQSLTWLWVNENALRGSIDASTLPMSLKILDLRSNYFIGKIAIAEVQSPTAILTENTNIETV